MTKLKKFRGWLGQVLPRSDKHRGTLAILIATFMFSLMTALSKELTVRYSVSETAFFRYFFALFPLMPLLAARGGLKVFRTRQLHRHLWRGVLGAACLLLYFYAASQLPLAESMAISYTNPIFITLLSMLLLKEKIGKGLWAAIIAGFMGVLLIAEPRGLTLNSGALAALGGAICQATVTIGVHKLSRQDGALTTLAWFSVFSTLLTLPLMLLTWRMPDMGDWLLMILCGCAGFCGQTLLTLAYKLATPHEISHFNYASIIWAALLGLVLWGQIPNMQAWIGAGIIIASGYYIVHRERLLKNREVVQP
ncbi:MAG TPA: DMT family transporter [Alphaproteobacteria bacterium]|nr:DMT family transporter [Alphaproteobacteria bacterium]